MNELLISNDVLGSLLPQPGMLNLSKTLLEGQTFVFANKVAQDDVSNDFSADNKNVGRIKFRYKNSVTKKAVTVGIRSLLYFGNTDLAVVPADQKFEDIQKVHEKLMSGDTADIQLPTQFTIVRAEDRIAKDENGNPRIGADQQPIKIYPAYMYESFKAKADQITRDHKASGKTGTPDISEIYKDYEYMQSLAGTPLQTRFKSPEATKQLVIKILPSV